jgi:hypothetical protein
MGTPSDQIKITLGLNIPDKKITQPLITAAQLFILQNVKEYRIAIINRLLIQVQNQNPDIYMLKKLGKPPRVSIAVIQLLGYIPGHLKLSIGKRL